MLGYSVSCVCCGSESEMNLKVKVNEKNEMMMKYRMILNEYDQYNQSNQYNQDIQHVVDDECDLKRIKQSSN